MIEGQCWELVKVLWFGGGGHVMTIKQQTNPNGLALVKCVH